MTRRLWRLACAVFILFLVVLLRLSWLQVAQFRFYEARASRQQTVTQTLEAKRGEILIHERERTFPVATTKEGWLLAIDPRKISDPEKTYAELTRLGPAAVTREEFIKKASKREDPYEVLEHRMEPGVKKRIEDANLAGVIFSEEDWRFYPAGAFASHVLGFVGAEGVGQYGIERFYDKDLRGENGLFVGNKTLGGKLLRMGENIMNPEQNGTQVLLTIDAGAESYLEKTIQEVAVTYHAASAGGIIVNPKTGRIIAMAGWPTFDPNTYSREKSIGTFKNPLVESVFEMGSVVKPLTMAAAFDAGVITPATMYVDVGSREIDGKKISNYDGKPRGRIPIQEILSQSLNMGAVFLAEQLGKDRFRTYFQNYGLGEKTGITLPNEARGNIKNLESPRFVEYATASFGQGIAVTSLEFVRALASIANGGLLVNPYIVEELTDDSGERFVPERAEPRRVLKEESAHEVTRMLVKVVDEKLAFGKGRITGYSVAAKTGTAQIASLDTRGYSGDFMHTFFGYGPAYDPEFLLFYYLERPRGVRYASETLTEPFRSTIKFLFSYFEVPPDRPQDFAPTATH